VDAQAGAITNHVAGILVPSLVGTDMARKHPFLDHDTLELSARFEAGDAASAAGLGGRSVLLWPRVD